MPLNGRPVPEGRCTALIHRGVVGAIGACRRPGKVNLPNAGWRCGIHDPARRAAHYARQTAHLELQSSVSLARREVWEIESSLLGAVRDGVAVDLEEARQRLVRADEAVDAAAVALRAFEDANPSVVSPQKRARRRADQDLGR